MQYQIVTFGNGETLKGVFDAIAMCLNAQTGTLYTPLLRIGMIFAVLWAAVYSIWGDFLKAWGKATIPLVLVPPLLFVPSATLNIHDVASNYRDKVDHVPYGLAYAAHFISQIGFVVTKQVDRVFGDVEDLKYHKSGFLMPSNLIQQARTFRIVNADVASNMREFVCQCVAYEAMLGYKYTFEDLRHSADIWELVSARPSKIRSFVWRHPHKPDEVAPPPEIIHCAEGVKRFNQLWGPELERAKTVLGTRLFGHTNPLTAKQELLKYLPLSYEFLSGMSKSADQILKQQMMVHAVVDGIEHKSVSLGNAPNFAAKRAYLQQRSTYETLGSMAAQSLMTMKAVLEALVYVSFIFLVPLAVLPFGGKILLSWVQTLLWLQLWAPLYAVLNFMMGMAARGKSLGMLSISNPDGITIASSAGLMDLNADVAAMAGYLAMSIPFLAIALVKGVGSFVHLASHLGNVSQGAAAQAAGDAVTGNYSFGNVSTSNQQIANTSMLAQTQAASYRAAAFQFVDGRADITTMSDGSQVAHVNVSQLPVAVNRQEAETAQLSEMAAQNYQFATGQMENSAKSLASSYRSMVDLSQNLAKSESLGNGVTTGTHAEQAKAIHSGAQIIQDFAKSHGLKMDVAASLFAEASAGIGLPFFKGAAGVRGSLNTTDETLLQEARKYMEDHHFQEAARQASQAASNLSHTLTDESAKRFAEGVSGSYEKGLQHRQEAFKSYNTAESFTQQAMDSKTRSAALNVNDNQQFLAWLATQRSDNTSGHIGHRGAVDIITRRPDEAMAWASQFMSEQGLFPSKAVHATPQSLQEKYQTETGHQVYTPTPQVLEEVRLQLPPEFTHPLGQEASVWGDAPPATFSEGSASPNTDPSSFNQNLSHRGDQLREQASGMMADVDRSIEKMPGSLARQGTKIHGKAKAYQEKKLSHLPNAPEKQEGVVPGPLLGEPQQK